MLENNSNKLLIIAIVVLISIDLRDLKLDNPCLMSSLIQIVCSVNSGPPKDPPEKDDRDS